MMIRFTVPEWILPWIGLKIRIWREEDWKEECWMGVVVGFGHRAKWMMSE